MTGNTGLKFIALAVLFEYFFIKPYIILPSDRDRSDFIGFGLVHAVRRFRYRHTSFKLTLTDPLQILAYFGKINIQDLDFKRTQSALLNGLLGGICSYAWLLFHLPYPKRQTHHILLANFIILLGVLFGAWAQRRKKAGGLSVGGGFLM